MLLTEKGEVAFGRHVQWRGRLGKGAATFYTTFQQLMLSLGICVGALALHASIHLNGRQHARLSDFSVAFVVVAVISLSATWWNMAFSHTTGAEISGHKQA